MGQQSIKTVPHQRTIEVNKAPTDKHNLYTTNNLSALDQAAGALQTKGGFKLYVYLAKNQNKYTFALSSADFMRWSGLGYSAYTSAFDELVEKGYLVESQNCKNCFAFYDKQQEQEEETKIVFYPAAIDGFVF